MSLKYFTQVRLKIILFLLTSILFFFTNCSQEISNNQNPSVDNCADGVNCELLTESDTDCPNAPAGMLEGTKDWINWKSTEENLLVDDDFYDLPRSGVYLKTTTNDSRELSGNVSGVHVRSKYSHVRIWISKCPGGPRLKSINDVITSTKTYYRCDQTGETPLIYWTQKTKNQDNSTQTCLLNPNTTYYLNASNVDCGESTCPTRLSFQGPH